MFIFTISDDKLKKTLDLTLGKSRAVARFNRFQVIFLKSLANLDISRRNCLGYCEYSFFLAPLRLIA